MSLKNFHFIRSFGFAIEGLGLIFKKERNFKIHCVAAILIITIGIFLRFNYWDWLIVLLIIPMVMAAEIFNSAIERICDLIRDELKLEYSQTRQIRNFSAGAVFLIASFSILIGIVLILK